MPKKSLQDWYNSNEITYSQKEIIKKFGVGDYYPECERRDFLKIYHWNDILERNVEKLASDRNEDLVYQINFFSAWWNNNLIIFIDGKENSYRLRLIVYEMPYRKNGETKMREIFEVFFVEWICPGDLSEARSEAKRIEEKLRSDNPILGGTIASKLSFFYYDDCNSSVFPFSFSGDEVKRIGVDFDKARYNPDDYFKPLDIAMVFNDEWVHACVCLGWDRNKNEYKICHALSGNQVKIESWESFLGLLTNIEKKIIRYHPVIAFKRTEEIIKHIANCVEGEENYYSRSNLKKGPFRIKKRDGYENSNNCENFVNRCVLGLDFSELGEKKAEEKIQDYKRKTELNISEHLNKTKSELNRLVDNVPWSRVNDTKNKIKEYRQNSGYEGFDVMRDGYNMYDACIEMQPKASIFKDMLREIFK